MWWLRRIHTSWLIALGSVAFVLGVLLALVVSLNYWLWVVIGIGCVIVSFWRKRVYVLPFLCIGLGLVGVTYGSMVRGDLSVYRNIKGVQIELTGHVREDPSINDSGAFVLQLDQIAMRGQTLPGVVWISSNTKVEVKRGDRVTIEGRLGEGFGNYAGHMYRAKLTKVTRSPYDDLGRVVRDWFADAVRRVIPEPQASLGIGFLTGQKSALPKDLSQALQVVGLSHVVVASGYNLTILVRLARRLFVKVSKFLSAFSSSIMIIVFVMITGLSPSMSRAGLVSGLSLASWYYGRQFHPFVLLPFAAAITVAFQPSYVWGDIGWELSFSAFAAVMIVGPLMQRFFFGENEPGLLRQILGETVAAHLVTIPIIVMGFGVISHVAIIANIMIVPFVPLAMLLTFISGVLSLALPSIADIASLPITWLLTYMTNSSQFLAGLTWAQTKLQFEWWGVIIYYLLLTAACVVMWRVTRFSLRNTNIVE
ncbi:MAG: rane protein of unknown function [Candidatus Saccharibacteria bacterium]|nr:rane protein of unknown function [Candidatus Saccharibacteria bacterium]